MATYSVVLFDVGGTLVRREPSDESILFAGLETLGISFSYCQAKKAWAKADEWSRDHLRCRLRGGPNLPDKEFRANSVRSAIESLCDDLGIPDHEELYQRYDSMPKQNQIWVPVDGGISRMLGTLRARGLGL